MYDESVIIRQQMHDTRAALEDKMETLEQQLVETMANANAAISSTAENVKEAVEGTVESIKDSVHETAESVKTLFDLKIQMGRHPWLLVGGAVAVGYVGGRLLQDTDPAKPRPTWHDETSEFMHNMDPSHTQDPSNTSAADLDEVSTAAIPAKASIPAKSERLAWLRDLAEEFSDEIAELKSLAIGATLGTLREVVVQSASSKLERLLTDVVNKLTKKLGGQILPSSGSIDGSHRCSDSESCRSANGEDPAKSPATETATPPGTGQG
jgi:prophage DNA circulation protein